MSENTHTTLLDALVASLPLASPRGKTLLTPSYLNPGILKRCLALRTGRLANLHVQQVHGFIVEQSLPRFEGRTYVAGDRRFWLMFDVLKRLAPRLKYFGDSVQFEGTCSLVLETIEELRLNGIDDRHLKSLPNAAKWNDIVFIMAEYDAAKTRHNLFDYADAVASLLTTPQVMEDTFLIKHTMSAFEDELVKHCGISVIDPGTPEQFSYTLSGYKVDTPYQEALQTIRNIMDDMKRASVPVRVGICTPNYNDTYYQMMPVLEKTGQPELVHFLKGQPLLSTPAGNLWKYFVEWISNSLSVQRLLRILESPAYDRGDVEPHVFHRAIRSFRHSELVLVDDGFLQAFQDHLEGRDPVDDDEREQMETDAAAVALKIAERFHPIAVAGSLREQLERLHEVFDRSVRIKSEADAAAIARIEAVLDETIAAAETMQAHSSFPEVARLISEKLNGLYVNVSLPDWTRPVVGTINDLLYGDFDTLYITGLNEKGPPGAFHENPILLDYEKVSLRDRVPSAVLQLKEDRLEEDERQFKLLRATAKHSLTMSAPLKDLATGREMLVSRYLLAEWNRHLDKHHDYKAISTQLGADPRSQNNYVALNPGETFYDYELAVAARLNHGGNSVRNPLLVRAFPFAEAAMEFRRRRRVARSFDEYWGMITANPERELPVMSATRLGLWAQCPYQYFLKNELGLRAEEEFDAHSLEWLDNLGYGNFLHELFYRFFLRLRAKHGEEFNTVDASDRRILDEEFDKVLEKFKRLYPVTSPFHYEETLARLHRDVHGYFEREMQNRDVRLFVELSFAMIRSDDREPLLRKDDPATISLSDGTAIRIRGAIDRVDRNADGRYLLIDYKSGRAKSGGEGTPFGGGELLQAGLYSEVVNQIDKRIVDPLFKFYFATDRHGFQEYVVDYERHRRHFIGFLTSIVKQIRRGLFVPVVKKDEWPCSYCDFAAVCITGRHLTGNRIKEADANFHLYAGIVKEEKEP